MANDWIILFNIDNPSVNICYLSAQLGSRKQLIDRVGNKILMMGSFFGSLLIALVIYFIVRKSQTIEKFRKEYHEAIARGNKSDALYYGRQYYAKMRTNFLGIGSGMLTHFDEQSISNDLSIMK